MRSVVASGLKNSSWAGFEYRYTIYENLNGNYLRHHLQTLISGFIDGVGTGNLLSMYSGHDSVFQVKSCRCCDSYPAVLILFPFRRWMLTVARQLP
jgi:hypothetical protein